MAPSPETPGLDPTAEEAVDSALLAEVGTWVGQLVRALKTCRLYDEANPTVVRVREELAASLTSLHAIRGPIHLQVGAHALSVSGHELPSARPGDDNLAAVLHRDGIRVLTIEPGMDARELDALVGLILKVTGPFSGEEDLVTLLWDANLPHVVIESVPLEGEADGVVEDESDGGTGAAWPRQQAGGATAPGAEASPRGATPESSMRPNRDSSRSDDWTTGDAPANIEQAFDELETGALVEIARFQQDCENERRRPIPAHAMRILDDCFAERLTDADRKALAGFVPGVLREALALGDWKAASQALAMLRSGQPDWPVEEFCTELCGPHADVTRRVVAALDGQGAEGVDAFLPLIRQLGTPAADWLMHVLAGSEQKDVRHPLTRVIAELNADQPERIIPWLTDDRWYVVRNAVHILGRIGGDETTGYLLVPSQHPEMRVRQEVVAALSQASSEGARSILVAMLGAAETPLFVAILHRLALDAHTSVQEGLLGLLRDESFARRSEPERRALLGTLATRGDAVLPALEEELNAGGGWFARRAEPDHTAIALCISRIATPAARAVLERGLRSSRKEVRRACRIAGASGESGDE
jgi:hypothetical protein